MTAAGTGLRDRVVLVIGAGGGIGAAVAHAFARAGCRMGLADLDRDAVEAAARRCGGKVCAVDVDVADPRSVSAAVARVHRVLGGVEVLVNCAGIDGEADTVDLTVPEWDRMLAVNLRGVFLACQAVLPAMTKRRWGRILNVASQMGQLGCARSAHYSAAKAGVLGFTRALAREVVDANVLVNAIAPGPVRTPMWERLDAGSQQQKLASTPLGRVGEPAEVAATALLLADDPGGNLYVGQTLGPCGGAVMA